MEIKDRIDSLRRELRRHNHNYYVLNSPEISDFEFDSMMRELENLEQAHPEFHDPLSPTQKVGSDLSKGFEQVGHLHPMLSLSNTYTIGEVDEFVNRCRTALNDDHCVIVGEMKFDGSGISLIYENGRLIRAVTRGDGVVGDIVTDNIRTIRSIPAVIEGEDVPALFELRGEVVLPWDAFDRLNAERRDAGEPLFANPRNAAAGTMKTLDTAEVARRGLDAYFYYLLGPDLPYDNHYDNMQAVKRWGFKVSDIMQKLDSIGQVDAFVNRWDTERKALPVATDGLVFKVNSLRQQLNLGYRAKSPRWAIAFKFKAERALTRLRHVSYEVGRSGVVTPVANLEPVLLSGTIVKRASLHNYDIIRQLDIHQNDMLYVEKGGEIIPKITGVEISERDPDAKPIGFVEHCPACGTPLLRNEDEAAIYCPNHRGCMPQCIGRIKHYVGRHMMNIDGIGEELATSLFSSGLVRDPADLYDLTKEQLLPLERMGHSLAERIIKGIDDSRSVPFERVLFAISIPGVGETVAKKLARAVRSIDNLIDMDQAALEQIPDIGLGIAVQITGYFRDPDNRRMVERLRQAGVQLEMPHIDEQEPSDILAGCSIVISGTFAQHSRDEYRYMIESNGGKNVGSISRKTSFILAGDNMGPAKLEKAQKLGIPLVDEHQFLRILDGEEFLSQILAQ